MKIRWCKIHRCEVRDPRATACLLWPSKPQDCEIVDADLTFPE